MSASTPSRPPIRSTSSVRESAARSTPAAPTIAISPAIEAIHGRGERVREPARRPRSVGVCRLARAKTVPVVRPFTRSCRHGGERCHRRTTRWRDRAVVEHDEPTVRLHVDRGTDDLAGREFDPDTLGRACRARLDTRSIDVAAASASNARRARGEHVDRDRPPEPSRAAPSGAHRTLRPRPTTTCPFADRCARMPASFRPSTSTSLGHFERSADHAGHLASPPATPRETDPTRRGRSDRRAPSRNSIETSRFEPGGASHVRSRRPRPAVW